MDKHMSLFFELYYYRTNSVEKLRKAVLCILGEEKLLMGPSKAALRPPVPSPESISSQTVPISKAPLLHHHG